MVGRVAPSYTIAERCPYVLLSTRVLYTMLHPYVNLMFTTAFHRAM
jgi:hypothetical protein